MTQKTSKLFIIASLGDNVVLKDLGFRSFLMLLEWL